jgi:hypothetical protein
LNEQRQRTPHHVVGFDPGLSGALAFYCPSAPHVVAARDLPVAGREINGAQLADYLEQLRPAFAIVELVGAMPKQGVSSTFRFGRAFGTILGVLAALRVPVHLVGPTRWKRHFRLSADKEQARALALRLWPECTDTFALKKHHGRAKAALLAKFAAETIAA